MPVGVPFFVAEMKREGARVNRVFARGGKCAEIQIRAKLVFADDALTAKPSISLIPSHYTRFIA